MESQEAQESCAASVTDVENCATAAMAVRAHGRDAHAAEGNGRDGHAPRRGGCAAVAEWQKISGLTREAEPRMSRSERRHALRKLFKEYERRIREALSEGESADAEGDPRERTYLWTPLECICFELGIARRKLSALTRELTGMAAHEVIDRIRAEGLRERLRPAVQDAAKAAHAGFLKKRDEEYRIRTNPKHESWRTLSYRDEDVARDVETARKTAEAGVMARPKDGWGARAGDALQKLWQARRERPELKWSDGRAYAARQLWARELGFSSYARLYRASLLCHGVTPQEIEHQCAMACLEACEQGEAGHREALKAEALAKL